MLHFEYSPYNSFISVQELKNIEAHTDTAMQLLESRNGPGNDFLGWLDLPEKYDREEFSRIKTAAIKIQQQSEVLIVIGIGGSYLGAKAAIEFCQHGFYNNLPKVKEPTQKFILPEPISRVPIYRN